MTRETPMHTYLDEGHENFMWRATGDLGGSILFVHVSYLTYYCSAKFQLETLSRHPQDLSIYAHICNTLKSSFTRTPSVSSPFYSAPVLQPRRSSISNSTHIKCSAYKTTSPHLCYLRAVQQPQH